MIKQLSDNPNTTSAKIDLVRKHLFTIKEKNLRSSSKGNINKIPLFKNDYASIPEVSPEQFIEALLVMEQNKEIRFAENAKPRSPQKVSIVFLNERIIRNEEIVEEIITHKREIKKEKRFRKMEFWLPFSVSIIALMISVIAVLK